MALPLKESIQKIKDLETLLDYCRDDLDWPVVDFDEIDNITFEYSPEELGISPQYSAKIISIKQLRPLVDNQQWGIFCIEFENKRLPVVALRKILSSLIPSKRRQKSDQAFWDKKDLLFICFFGDQSKRVIGFVHFKDDGSSLPSIKTFYWEPKNEITFNSINLDKLKWPMNEKEFELWQEKWSEAFNRTYRQVIKDSKELSKKLAELASKTRNLIIEVYEIETENGPIHELFADFKSLLIHDLSIESFADMYAQTISYGLFSARCMDTDGHFELSEVIDRVPNTNPFLKELIKRCFDHGFRESSKVNFDELEIGEIVDLLDQIDTDEILADFGRQTGGGTEDPVIHFYEGFLNEYEHEQKVQRGVFYTPDHVVNFIVRSVDEVLKNGFGCINGLADESTKKIKYFRKSKVKNKKGLTFDIQDEKDVSLVQILDPATGTGTFLKYVILQIKENFNKKHSNKSRQELARLWNDYINQNLLDRIFGFELMMAPYSVAHMKLGLLLKETGYDFPENKRLKIYLTNTLEEPGDTEINLFNVLSQESCGANEVKISNAINVIIGNPPYLGISANNSNFISNLLRGISPNGEKTANYFEVDGESLNERNPKWLNDDYVKFIRIGQYLLEKSKSGGILAFITNHGFINNPTFRGMRQSLLEAFDDIYIIDLHGNVKKKESSPDGSKDENVFDIQQGVSINFFIRYPNKKQKTVVYHKDLWGLRDYKYQWLSEKTIDNIDWTLVKPSSPFYLFVPQDVSVRTEYEKGISVKDIFEINGVGMTTARDHMVIDYSAEPILKRVTYFRDSYDSDVETCRRLKIPLKKGWDVAKSRRLIQME